MRAEFVNNLEFAKAKNISLNWNYSVTPHHSGIYPVLPKLFKIWSETYSIKATSTITFPNVNPNYLRRGFIFNNIMVAPRQTSFMFSTDSKFNTILKNADYWIELYKGGGLFEIILYNQVSIFMTHVPNYAHDRLANFILRNVFEFLSCWTNLKFYSLPPLSIVEKYFEFNQDDKEPVWSVREINRIQFFNLNYYFIIISKRTFVVAKTICLFGKKKVFIVVGFRKYLFLVRTKQVFFIFF